MSPPWLLALRPAIAVTVATAVASRAAVSSTTGVSLALAQPTLRLVVLLLSLTFLFASFLTSLLFSTLLLYRCSDHSGLFLSFCFSRRLCLDWLLLSFRSRFRVFLGRSGHG